MDTENIKTKKMGLDDVLGLGKPNNFSVEYGSITDFYLSGNIGEATDYIDWFQKIRSARQTDLINIHINCPGGNLFTTVQFLQVLSECNAHIVMNVSGACMSAATLIFLMGDEFVVNDHSAFLFHNYSGGMIGKGGEMYSNVVHDRKWSEKLFRSQYQDFLTAEEISQLVDDKDIWMDAATVVERLESRGQAIRQKEEEALKESKKAEDRKSRRGSGTKRKTTTKKKSV